MLQAFHQLHIHSVVPRRRSPIQHTDLSNARIWVQGRPTANRQWPLIALWCERRDDIVDVVGTEWLMDAVRSGVASLQDKIMRKLLLHVQVPLHDVIAARVWLDVAVAQARRSL